MRDKKNRMKQLAPRVWALAAVAVLVMGAFVLQLVNFQLINGEEYLSKAASTQSYKFSVGSARGDIVDRYGRAIATNVTGHKLELSKGMMTGDMNETLKELVEILQSAGEEWNDTLLINDAPPWQFTIDPTADAGEDAALARAQRRLAALKTDFGKQTYATADEVMEAMVEKYALEDYDPRWQRILAGIRYQMQLDGFGGSLNFTLAGDISMKTVAIIKERSLSLSGAEIVETSTRVYPDGTVLPHVLGTVGPIYAEDWNEKKDELKAAGYKMNSLIGHGGLEEAMEEYLRGTDGLRTVEYSRDGTVHRSWLSEEPQPGDTVVLTVNMEFQQKVDQLLEKHILALQKNAPGSGAECRAGSAVVIDVKTGGILALGSYPSYDLNSFRENYSEYANDPDKPLVNRALQGVYSPGSTFKPSVALCGLLNGTVTPNTRLNCVRAYTLIPGMRPPSCLAHHGPIDVYNALKYSCNWYFFELGRQLGIDTFGEFAKRMGLGERTGVEVGEAEGHITETTDEDYTYGYVLNAAIGQQNTRVTPVQLATYAATIANNGVRYRTHLVAGLRDSATGELVKSFDSEVVETIGDEVGAFDAVKEGMVRMATQNSRALAGYPITLAAKTGTPQTGRFYAPGRELFNGALILFAPAEDPEIAIGILLENSGSGAATAYLARDILDAYFFGQNASLQPDEAGVLLP